MFVCSFVCLFVVLFVCFFVCLFACLFFKQVKNPSNFRFVLIKMIIKVGRPYVSQRLHARQPDYYARVELLLLCQLVSLDSLRLSPS